ncbi:helix-turn-helix domain-containing protein [Streptomyces nojiriensis]
MVKSDLAASGGIWMEERRKLFGGLLRGARERVGLTQETLAERSGLSARAIGNLERGRAKPRADSLRRIVYALGALSAKGPHWWRRPDCRTSSRRSRRMTGPNGTG